MGDVGSVVSIVADPLDLTGYRSGQAADKALDAQTNAANNANATQKYIYDQNREDTKQWRESGAKALTGMEDPSFSKSFSAEDFRADPGYQFRLDEGLKAVNASASARGNATGGATMKALMKYGQGVADQTYNDAYNRYNNDRNIKFNQLSTLAGFGNSANSTQVQSASNYGNNVSANQIGMGNAQAANYIGKNNQQSQAIGQLASIGAMAFSDERLKTDIEEISQSDLAEMRKHLKPYFFKYKSEDHGKGEWAGVMAQDLEKSRLGKTLVVENEKGEKMIDMTKVISLFLATLCGGEA